ncbi:C45 family autoproteolytic acyltransferase/hydolase [Gillisia hiemivivida]|uniref:Acyl-CoA--6-aminopenicillanic acid acyltransferase n=1 Tax=Gillisia hiemivivida TaxID=291190 RepID=A0A5C6ZST9_9FLAO|nr:C45 family peptidase [Gillisia hiemivivida]TXD91787.1 acyl-CoA--6-aminopenicillanic acid acyltransferase [Gillisia hiemivivida]
MQLHFNAISEPAKPGKKWQKLFNTYWPAYQAWYNTKGVSYTPDLETSQAALKKYMPKMWPTYQKLCKLAQADDVAARFLTGFQPPAYISACSQAVITGREIQLVRNYDYHPDLMEGTQLLSAWNGKKVIATSDCLVGAVDGMNDDGLAISLTFGGRKEVGVGFGIPFILRYVLEFCSNVEEAVDTLVKIPSHMSYNVTVVDKTGTYKTVQLSPDNEPVVTDAAFTTNHQGTVDWPENAAFNKTLERSAFIEKMLSKKDIDGVSIADAFLKKPLYNTLFKEGFGTLFTAVYRPAEGVVETRWPNLSVKQTFNNFKEEYHVIQYTQSVGLPLPISGTEQIASETKILKPKPPVHESSKVEWQETVSNTLVDAMALANPSADKKELENIRGKLINRGQVSWELLADFWSKTGSGYGDSWKN